MGNDQCPSTNVQTMTKCSMPQIPNGPRNTVGNLELGNPWTLVLGQWSFRVTTTVPLVLSFQKFPLPTHD